ncbi:NAD(P)H-dependent oxidoreductase [Nicoliella lavandulae]|uniref:NAD(P)H-dependent oxidoreductase n=1 Tax=Nicoliella lavandulae TaxID=3082954 RepID=A0ABU8SM12_9LACO
MKILVIQGHPDSQSLTHTNAMHYYEAAKQMGFDVDMIDLSHADFDPVLRYGYHQHMSDESFPKHCQDLIQAADHLAFFFPIWWSAEPSVLKGWLDRVLTPKFAYYYDEKGNSHKLLQNKTADVFTSSNGPAFFYRSLGNVIFRWKYLVLGFCGIKLKHGLVLGRMVKNPSHERCAKYIEKCTKTLEALNSNHQ